MTRLNDSQQKAVEAVEGLVMIDAVAGSGKTTVLTHRVKHMLEQGIKPNQIMLTTFTKKATEEMTERLSKLIPKMKLMQMTIGTTHSIGYRILAKEYEAMNNPMYQAFKRRNILMNAKQKYFGEQVVKDIIYDRTVPFSIKEELKEIPLPQLMKVVASSKNQGMDWDDFEAMHSGDGSRMETYIEFFKNYELKKQRERAIDGDDMLFLLWKLLKENPTVLKKYQGLYKYVMVDEAQDNNTIQYDIFKMLAMPENNLFLVGDIDQSMYAFRGARPDEFLNFAKQRGMQRIALEDNYRSSPCILEVANNLIVNNTQRLDKKLVAHRQDDSKNIAYSRHENESEESAEIVEDVKSQINKGRKHKDIAVLYRTNAQSRSMEDALIMAGLPYVIHGGISFYERKEVKDIVAYLQLVTNPHNDKAFSRVINVPSRFLGKAFMEKVRAFKGSHWDAIEPGILNFKPYEKDGTANFRELIHDMIGKQEEGMTPSELVDYLLEDGGYKKYILGEDDEEESSRMENISTLKFVLGRYENVKDFLDYIELMTSKAKHSIDGVQLMTVHKSKGLEYKVCYVVGVSDGLLPHFRSIEDMESGSKPYAVEEERRLLYVAITRAEEECYISSIQSFNGRPAPASRFIPELGMDLTDENKVNAMFEDLVYDAIRKEEALMHEMLED